MSGYDLSPGRLRARWRKLRRDPAGFADDLPWPAVRGVALGALAAWTRTASAFDGLDRAADAEWAGAGVALRPADGGYALLDQAGRPPRLWPRRIALDSGGARAVVFAFDGAGRLTAAADTADGLALLSLDPRPSRLTVYGLNEAGAAPVRIDAEPASRADVIRLATAGGDDLAHALREAWPAAERRPAQPSQAAYRAWILRNEPGPGDEANVRAWLRGLVGLLRLSILMPVRDPKPAYLRAALESVRAQWFDGWRLIVCDDGSRDPAVIALLDEAAKDPRIELVRLGASRGVAVATNAALEAANGEACLFMDHDDLLAPHACALIAAAFAEHPAIAAVYSDEDVVDAAGRRADPAFKSDFDRERLLAQNYVNHAFAVRTDVLRRLGGLADGLDGAQDHDLVLRVAEAGGRIVHLPHVLYHWRVFPGGSTLSQREGGRMAERRLAAVRDHLGRAGEAAEARIGAGGYVEVVRTLAEPPPVTAVVPTRDRPELLRACAAGLLRHTDYPDLRLVVVDNGSRDPAALALLGELRADRRVTLMTCDAPFNFAALCNLGAVEADGGLLAFVNDDVLVAEPGWLRTLAVEAARPDVGAVGPMLLYPDGRIQHAGVTLGLGPQGAAGHDLRGRPGNEPGPQSRLLVQRQASAVTAACLVVETAKFDAVGGFDADAFPVAFNDVDLCLRLASKGWRTIWTPRARLAHLESATRGSDRSAARAAAFAEEAARLRERWPEAVANDPFYSPNLTLADESFGLAGVSRAPKRWIASTRSA